jgi:thiamine kinase-like enzyme
VQKFNNNKIYIKKKIIEKTFTKKDSINFEREIYFYNYFKNTNLNIPNLINIDYKKRKIFLEKLVTRDQKISDTLFLDSLYNFIISTNSIKTKKYLVFAKEAFLSVKDLTNNIQNRIIMLKKIKNKILEEHIKIIEHFFFSHMKKVKNMHIKKCKFIISQSDIGIHNFLVSNKKSFFIDFEYAGLDSPLKIISDTYYQPEMNIARDKILIFINKLSTFLDKEFSNSMRIVEKFFQIKMSLIVLNIFLNSNNTYKNFNFGKKKISILEKIQLKKSIKILNKKNIF